MYNQVRILKGESIDVNSIEIIGADEIAYFNCELLERFKDEGWIVRDGPFIALRGNNSFANYKVTGYVHDRDQLIGELISCKLFIH